MVKENEKKKKVLHKTQALIMLERGVLPKRTKFGTEFKGKNLIIICKNEKKRRSFSG